MQAQKRTLVSTESGILPLDSHSLLALDQWSMSAGFRLAADLLPFPRLALPPI